jgi:ABC-type uncharacterized transport system involved in gliding motility auxiliary subunit
MRPSFRNESRAQLKRNLIPAAGVALLVVGLVAVNVLAALLPLRLDITQERLFTLTDGTHRILNALKEPVTIKLYVPDSVPDAPVTVKTFARRARDLLQQYQSASHGKLTLQVFDPKPDSEDEDWATRYGLSAAQMPDGTKLYLGLVVLAGGREAAIPFLDPRRERFLEYDISQAVARVNQPKRQKIGILPGLPIYGQQAGGFGQTEGEWTFVRELRKSYQVDYLFPQDLTEVPDGMAAVIVLHPKGLTDAVLFALDQYLLRGGKLIVLTDPNSRMDPMGGQGFAAATSSNLDKLYKAWGVKFDANMVVADQQLATRVNTPNQGIVEFPLWLSLHAAQLNRDLVVTSQLEEITLIDPGAFSLEPNARTKLTALMSSTPNSGLVDLATVRFSSPLDISKQLKTDGKVRILAGLLTGTFDTAFPEGRPKPPPPPKPDKGKPAAKADKPEPEKPLTHPVLARAAQEGSILLVGDADFIADRFSVQTSNFFGNIVTQPINDNLSFILNAAEFMAGSQDLIQIRSRGQVSRPFTRLANMQLQAARKFQEREQFLTQRLDEVKKKLETLQSQKQEGQKQVLTVAQLEEVRRFRGEEAQVRAELREVRKVLRQDIETLGSVLLAINLLAMPLLVAAGGFVVILRRGRRRGGRR